MNDGLLIYSGMIFIRIAAADFFRSPLFLFISGNGPPLREPLRRSYGSAMKDGLDVARLKLGIDIAWAAAIRGIACNIFEFAIAVAAWAGIGRVGGRQQKPAISAFPIGKTAIGT
ncbi:MAG: hypothetical protein R6W72_01145 [Desulfurivibrionaceae bacterium]